MRVHFSQDGWNGYLSWTPANARTADADALAAINQLIEAIRRDPFRGAGKPEPLRGDYQGWWSRRITREHRLVYRLQGVADRDQRVEIAFCRGHY